jgi:Fe-S-cluster containining protein
MADAPQSAPDRPVWYADGLRFACQEGCGKCCVNRGTHTYLYLEDEDVERLASFLKLTRRKFLRRYTTTDDGDRVLRSAGPGCLFLEGTRCGVHAARPRQCRTYPFWPQNVEFRSSWRRAARFCPGIDKGETHSLRTIRRQLAACGD